MTDASGDQDPRKRLMLEVVRYFQQHKEFPKAADFQGAHADDHLVLDDLLAEGSLQTRDGQYLPTRQGLLKYAAKELSAQFEAFDRLLNHLKDDFFKPANKGLVPIEYLSQLAMMPIEEVAQTVEFFLPVMKAWGGYISGSSGPSPVIKVYSVILDIDFFGDVTAHSEEQEGFGMAPRLAGIRVDGYRALEGFAARLEPITVIIGANAAGKSSLFDLLALISFATEHPLPPEVDPRSVGRALFHRGSPERIAWELRVEREERRPLRYAATIQGPVGQSQVASERLVSLRAGAEGQEPEAFTYLEFKGGKGSVRSARRDLPSPSPWTLPANELAVRRALDPNLITLNGFREYVSAWRFYFGFDVGMAAAIRRPVLTEPGPVLREDGSNLSAVLFHLMTEQQERWAELETHLRSAIPAFRSLSIKSRGGPGTVIGIWREEGVDDELTFADLSDGTLRFLCWATLCLSKKAPLVCIDEPEIGLHPRVLPVLAGLLRQASAESQLLVATHSPYFLSQFSLEEIAVMKKVDGRAVFARPASNEALRREIEELGGDLAQLHISDELEARS